MLCLHIILYGISQNICNFFCLKLLALDNWILAIYDSIGLQNVKRASDITCFLINIFQIILPVRFQQLQRPHQRTLLFTIDKWSLLNFDEGSIQRMFNSYNFQNYHTIVNGLTNQTEAIWNKYRMFVYFKHIFFELCSEIFLPNSNIDSNRFKSDLKYEKNKKKFTNLSASF